MNKLDQLVNAILRLWPLVSDEEIKEVEKRALSMDTIYSSIISKLDNRFSGMAWPIHIYMENGNQPYIVYAYEGRLWKSEIDVNNDSIALSDPTEVVVEHRPTSNERNVFRVFRNEDGVLRFVAIAASSVINRVAEIDSRDLFDSFEENFDPKQKPFMSFYHYQDNENLRWGFVDEVFRMDNLLIALGWIDEESVIGRNAEKKIVSGEWGMSIGYQPFEEPYIERMGDVEIPVYRKGKLIEISLLREKHAANLFTNFMAVKKERENMPKNRNAAREALADYLGDSVTDDELDSVLDEIGVRNRTIQEENMVTRQNGEEEEVDEELVSNENSEEETEAGDFEIILEDAVFEAVEERVNTLVNPIMEQLNEAINNFNAATVELQERMTRYDTFMKNVERSELEKVQSAIDDMPASRKRVFAKVHRPTERDVEELFKEEKLNSGGFNTRAAAKAILERSKS